MGNQGGNARKVRHFAVFVLVWTTEPRLDSGMRVCAITMVYRDHWALRQWYLHYARHLGPQNLFIVVHGPDASVPKLCPEANLITVPRDNLASFDRMRSDLLNRMQDEMGSVYDWVIRTDVDELICLDPKHFESFAAMFDAYEDARSLFALGLDVIESADDAELRGEERVLEHRRHAVFSGHYSKAFAARRGTHLARHGIVNTATSAFTMPSGVYLVHLKYANIDALQMSNEHRIEIANGTETGLPGEAWRKARRQTLRFLHRFEALPHVDWPHASEMAYDLVSDTPETSADKGVMRARSLQFDHRTILPEWFAQA